MRAEDIARVCHNANRALQIVNNDPAVSPLWDDAPDWQRASTIDGVARAQAGESPEELHQSWSDFKRDAGWTHGAVKDATAKTHPSLVPYEQLPSTERLKDDLFHAIVKALT